MVTISAGKLISLALCAVLAQSGESVYEPISADNIARLQSAASIAFDDLPDAAGEIVNGRFIVNTDGTRFGVVNRANAVVALSDSGELVGLCSVTGRDGLPATFIEGVFGARENVIVSLHTDGPASYYVSRCDAASGEQITWSFPQPLAEVWADSNTIWASDLTGGVVHIDAEGRVSTLTVPSPDTDPSSAIRIGRIAPPLAVSVTNSGLVKRWDLENGAVTAAFQVETGLPIYGHLSSDGRYLVWRDPPSTALYVLDFAVGTNVVVTQLNGAYIPFVFVTPAGDAVVGVQIDDQPVVSAWEVASGVRHNLGQFRACGRPPDMARLSADGTALIIGCDTGIDVWRVETDGAS